MKLRQKAKYVAIGALGMTVAIPLILKATDAVPITFSQGDILSAEVLNTLFGRLNDVQKGFSSNADLVGTWSCTSYSTRNDCTGSWTSSSTLLSTLTQTVTISANGNILSVSAATTNPGDCTNLGPTRKVLDADLKGNRIALANNSGLSGTAVIAKKSPTEFSLDYAVNVAGDTFAVCTKQSQPPTPPTALDATLTGSSVTLTWTDQSSDETGFKVQTKTAVDGTWSTLSTTSAGATSYTATAATGNNWYRVLATNANGDSITSNEILVER
jgi:hypothetical protein